MAQLYQIGTHKTVVFTEGTWTKVVYHSTPVVKFNYGSIILNSGGWDTLTTKTRMNQTSNQFDLGFKVYQKNFDWFVDYKGKTYDFSDDMTLLR